MKTFALNKGGRPITLPWAKFDRYLPAGGKAMLPDNEIARRMSTLLGRKVWGIAVLKRRRKLGVAPFAPRSGA